MEEEQRTRSKFRPKHWQVVTAYLVVYDALAIALSFFVALWLRFDCRFNGIDSIYLTTYYKSILIYIVLSIFVFSGAKLYRTIWRFASYHELYRMTISTAICFVLNIALTCIFFHRMPISYYLFGTLMQFVLTIGIRFVYRFVRLFRGNSDSTEPNKPVKRVMLIGAGESGQMILRDIKMAKEVSEKVYCIIDDNPNKWGRLIDGVEVVGVGCIIGQTKKNPLFMHLVEA